MEKEINETTCIENSLPKKFHAQKKTGYKNFHPQKFSGQKFPA